MLTKKENRILQLLSLKKDPVTSSEISTILGYSVRSVKNYIKNINELFPNAVSSSGKGYTFNRSITVDFLSEDTIPQTFDERKMFLFKNILKNGLEYELDDLADCLCISSDTLYKEIRLFNHELMNNNLKIVITDGIVSISGSEKNKRLAISRFITNDIKNTVFSYSTLQKYYPDYQIDTLHEIIVRALKKEDYYLDDFSIFSLLLHIVIAADRSKIQSELNLKPSAQSTTISIPDYINELVSIICKEVTDIPQVYLSPTDYKDLAVLLYTRLVSPKEIKNAFNSSGEELDADVLELIKKIDNELQSVYNIHFNDYQSKLRFYIHIKNLCVRAKNKIDISNPMISEAKNHIYIYDVAISIALIIERKYNCTISEDEVAYIAIHLIFSFNQETNFGSKLSVLLICPNYQDIQYTLAARIKNTFGNDIAFLDTIGYFKQLDPSCYDLILSTIDGKSEIPYNYLKISTNFQSDDIYEISKAIETIKKQRREDKFLTGIQFFFKPELFFIDHSEDADMENVLSNAADILYQKNYVADNYKSALLMREQFYPTTYGDVAIPHPLNPNVIRSAIAVCINKKGIHWCNGQTVKVVFILALCQKEQSLFTEIFDSISLILSNPESVRLISKVKSHQQFMDLLCTIFKSI